MGRGATRRTRLRSRARSGSRSRPRARPRSDAAEGLSTSRRLWRGLVVLAVVLAIGTFGYVLLGLSPLDAAYQTVTTVGTVGFREMGAVTTAWKVFTIVVVLAGASIVLYNLGVMIELLVEGRLTDQLWRRRMQRDIDSFRDHVIICGYGRVGQAIARSLDTAGRDVVVIDSDPARTRLISQPFVEGDAGDEEILTQAGVEHASTLIAATETDAANVYITLTARAMCPDLFIVARARIDAAEAKLRQAGADRVVNPQLIGGGRMAALALQPHVAEFLDIVMHDGNLEFRLEEVAVDEGSPLAGATLRDAHLRDRTGAMVLALRQADGTFVTNPTPDEAMAPGQVLIAIGTGDQLAALAAAARPPASIR